MRCERLLVAGLVMPALVAAFTYGHSALAPVAAFGQSQPNDQTLTEKLKQQKSALEQSKKRENQLEIQGKRLEQERADINRKLKNSAKAVQKTEGQLIKLERDLGKLNQEEARIQSKLSIENKSIQFK